jgi:hypothetical protein
MKDSPLQYVYPCKSATNEQATKYSKLLLLLVVVIMMMMVMKMVMMIVQIMISIL